MGTKLLKIVGYVVLFFVSFLVFLYWMFPYDALKDRIGSVVAEQLGGDVDIEIGDLSPYWFTGVDIKKFAIKGNNAGQIVTIFECKRLKARASLFSLLVRRPSVSFDLKLNGGEVDGNVKQSEELLAIDAELDDVDLKNFSFITSKAGLVMTGKINGDVDLKIDKQRSVNSTGNIFVELVDWKIAAGEAKFGEMVMPLPDLVLTKGRDARIKANISKGSINFDSFKFAGGDLLVDLKGKVFMSSKTENYRFNLNGSFTASQKLNEAMPFLFIIEQQKQQDGSYPLNVTGRLTKPTIKIGTFTVPM